MPRATPASSPTPHRDRTATRHVVFYLFPGLPLFCLVAALEVLRHANRWRPDAYRWSFLGDHDRPVADSNGLLLQPTARREALEPGAVDRLFIVAGFDAGRLGSLPLTRWLQRHAGAGTLLGGLSNGAFVLAGGGLLDGYAATAHWEDFASFCALHPRVRARYRRFVIDRTRATCSGGASTLELFIELTRRDLGDDLAARVARQMLLDGAAPAPGASAPLAVYAGRRISARLQRALNLLDADLDGTLGVAVLAARVGLGRRELLRLFRREIGRAPGEVLRERRLERARSLVLSSPLPLSAIAGAVGFSSQSHLTRCYRERYGVTPARARRARRDGSGTAPPGAS